MYPGMMGWWKYGRGGCGEDRPGWHGGWHHRHGCHGHDTWSAAHGEEFGGGAFGVRRPLRFLAYRLELDDDQVAALAKILDALKVERAQAEVDRRRTVSTLAEALDAEPFDADKADQGVKLRVESAERLRQAVLKALSEMHALLRPDQRKQLAYLIRTGALVI